MPSVPRSWATQGVRTRDTVYSFLVSLIDSSPVAGHRDLLTLHLVDSRRAILSEDPFAPIDIPVLAYNALAPQEPPPIAVAAACTLVYLGADLLDNVADNELSGAWLDAGPDAATLAAATYLSSLTYLALDRHPGTDSERRSLMAITARGLHAMSAGQYGDVGNHAIDVESSARVTELKAGAEFALFMSAAAIAADAAASLPDRFYEIGTAVGTAIQLASDIHDIFKLDPSPDLTNGRVTLPVVHALSVLRGKELVDLKDALTRCRTDPTAHAETRSFLRHAGGLRYAAVMVEVNVQRALRLIRELDVRTDTVADLANYVRNVSLLQTRAPSAASRTLLAR